jgi:hypothetical protein
MTVVEELLAIAAMLACFVYPVAMAARSAGAHIAADTEAAHETMLHQVK